MRVNRCCWLLLHLLAAAILAGCGSPPDSAPKTGSGDAAGTENASAAGNAAGGSANSASSQLKVALLTPGDINDQGWNQLAFEGLEAVEKSLGAEVAHQVTKNPAEHQPALRDFGDRGFELVICHGFEYGERVKAIAPKYPDTMFVVVGGNVKQAPNVATLVPKLEDATYLLGMAAGGLTKSNKLGLIGGMKLPVIASTFLAFEQGAKAVKPDVKILTSYVGDFENQNKAKEAANVMIAQGADLLFHNADQAGKGMFNAAEAGRGALVFGSNRNQNSVAAEVCLASAVIELPRAFVELARDAQSKKIKPEFRELNLQNGNISVQWNAQLKNKVPAALLRKIEAASAQIKSGKLRIKRNV